MKPTLLDLTDIPKVKLPNKQKWRNALQEYCDENQSETGTYCICNYMSYCDKCDGKFKNSCAKAIIKLANEKRLIIDYEDYDFEKLIKKVEEMK